MRCLRFVLLGLLALAALLLLFAVPPTENDRLPQKAAAETLREVTDVTLSGPRVVVVRKLGQGAGVRDQEGSAAIPRLTPDTGVRAIPAGAPQAEAKVVDSAARQGLEPKAPPGISTNFEGLDDNDDEAVTGFTVTPPDQQLAVGPNHVVEFVNIVGRITNKSGAAVVPDFSLASFFAVPPGSADFDPKVIYDDIHDRFFASYVSIDPVGDGFLHLAISQTSDPTGAWNVYFAGPYAGAFPDYPGVGVTNDKFTISYNLFDTTTFLFVGEETLVVQKSDVMAGAAADAVFFDPNFARFTVRPAQNLSPGNDQYLTTWNIFSFTQLTVIRITGTPDASNVTEASATNVTTQFHDSPPPSLTAGPGTIDSGDWRVLEAIWRDGSLWASSSAICTPPGDGSSRSCAHLVETETVGAPSLVQDIMFGAAGQYFSWPAIRTDAMANLYVPLTRTNPSIFAEAGVAGRLASDPVNTMSGSNLLRAGEIVHQTGRWGDYLGAAVDPSFPACVWVVGQYAKDTGGPNPDFGYWGTYIAANSYSSGCPSDDPDGDAIPNSVDPDDDGDGHYDNDETAKGSDPLDPTSTPEHCDGVDNDGDTVVDEEPAGGNWDIDGDTVKDCLDASVDTDGDGIVNTVDTDDDGDGSSDTIERSMSTDELDPCPGPNDALPSDADKDKDSDVGDVINLFLGKIKPPNPAYKYSARSDGFGVAPDGDNDVGDVISGFLGKIGTKCYIFTFTNTTGGAADRIDITFSASITPPVFSALDNSGPPAGSWNMRDTSGNPTVIIRRTTGNLANGGVLEVVVRGPTSPALTVSSSSFSLVD